jgi:hypothetical protein
MNRLWILWCALGICASAGAAEKLTIKVSHDLDAARPSETVAIPWLEVNKALPGALLQRLAVKDAAGHLLAYQVTNVEPQAKDPEDRGVGYGELIFQYDFAKEEQSAVFTVEKSATVSGPFPVKAFARYVPERLDDFAWENDKVAHRTYGQALAAPAPPGSDKEVLVTSGVDIWFKRVSYPIVDRWYNKGHNHYHKDEGEGLDMYGVGRTRGAGGTGLWDGKQLYTSRNYARWKVIANGPIRAVFELTFDAWDAGGVMVSEVKRFTVDAGHYFDQVDSTFSFDGRPGMMAAIGLNRTPAYAPQQPVVEALRLQGANAMAQWVTQKNAGNFGTAVIVPEMQAGGYAQDTLNELVLAPVKPGQPLRYYLGAAPSWSGELRDMQDWQRAIEAMARRIRHPIVIRIMQ